MSPLAEHHRASPATSGVSYRAVAAGKGRLLTEGKGRGAGLKSGKKQEDPANDSATRGKHAVLSEKELATFRTCFCTKYHQNKCPNSDSCEKSHCLTWQRRNPYEISYCPQLCPEIQFVKKSRKMVLYRRCTRGKTCNFAHSKEEGLYHPLVYKTKQCSAWPKCSRYFCPFVHSPSEMRDVSHLKHLEPSNFTGQAAAYSASGEKALAPCPSQQIATGADDTFDDYQTAGAGFESSGAPLGVCGPEKTSIIDYDLLDDFDVLNYTTSRLAAQDELDQQQQECLRVGCEDDEGLGFVDFASKFSSGLVDGTGSAFGFEGHHHHVMDPLNADASTCTATATASSTATAAAACTMAAAANTGIGNDSAGGGSLWYDAPTLAAICAYDDDELDAGVQQQQYFVGGSGVLYPQGAVAPAGGYGHGQDGLVLIPGHGLDANVQGMASTLGGGDGTRRLLMDEAQGMQNEMVLKSLYAYDYDAAAAAAASSSSAYPSVMHDDYGLDMACNVVVDDGLTGHLGASSAMHPSQQQQQMLQHPAYFYPSEPTVTSTTATSTSHPRGTLGTSAAAAATTMVGAPMDVAQWQSLTPVAGLTCPIMPQGQQHAFFERLDNSYDPNIVDAGADEFTPVVFASADDGGDPNAIGAATDYGRRQQDGRLFQLEYGARVPLDDGVASKHGDYRDLEQRFCNLDLGAGAGVGNDDDNNNNDTAAAAVTIANSHGALPIQEQMAGDAALVSLPVNTEDYNINDMLLKFINEIEK